MTTICTDGHAMAGNGQVTGGSLIHMTDFVKVHRLPDGRIVGYTGTPYDLQPLCDFLNGTSDALDVNEDGFEALILHPDGNVESMNGKGRRFSQSGLAAVGSGAAVALGAMTAGASPVEAIEIARRLDAYTGGKITEIRRRTHSAASIPRTDNDGRGANVPNAGSHQIEQ